MSPEKEKILFDTFPLLYRGRKLPITQNLMAFGFEVCDEWFNMIFNLSKSICEIADKLQLNENNYPLAVQVKEKFGELRFYCDNTTEEMDKLIERAEIESENI